MKCRQRWPHELVSSGYHLQMAQRSTDASLGLQASFGVSALRLIVSRQTVAMLCRYLGTYAPNMEVGQTTV